jgi:hypothetical protein
MRVRTLRSREEGILLVDCLIYTALFLVITTVAAVAYYHVEVETRALDRNSDDIVRAMKAGEQWRAEIRTAIAPPRMENGTLKLTTKAGDVVYTRTNGIIWRQAGQDRVLAWLERVKSSTMEIDARQNVTAWRWELELETKRAQASVRPLFTFTAVPSSEVKR